MAVPANRIPVLIAILACAAGEAAAAPRPLDRARVHGLYQDGEFEKVVGELASYGKGACACTRDDSVFAEKHLAVVLAANPVTRELGRYHMHRLLELAPRADLLDMYIGEEVDGVFEKVRKEHALREADPAPKPGAVRKPGAEDRPSPRAAAAQPAPAPTLAQAAAPAVPAPKAYSDAWARLPAAIVPSIRAVAPVTSAKPMAAASHAPSAHPVSVPPAGRATPVPAAGGRPAPSGPAAFGGKLPAPGAGSPRSRNAATAAKAPSKAYSPWDAIPSPSAHASVPTAAEAATAASGSSASRASRAGRASGRAGKVGSDSAAEASRPAWKEPGLWIGGGAAIAAIAFTLWQAGSEGGDPAKTYAVPASLEK